MMKPLVKVLGLGLLVGAWVLMSSADAWAFSLLGLPEEANFALGDWQASVEGGYEYEDQQTSTEGAPEVSLVRNRFDERFDLRNEGYSLIDPRLLDGIAAVNLDFYQEQDKSAGQNQSINGLLYGYDLNETIVGETAYPATVFSSRHETQTSTEFAGRTDVTTSNFGFDANLRDYSFLREMLPYFTSSLIAREDETDATTNQLGYSNKLDDTRDTVIYNADKGFQTADLDLSYEFVDDRSTGVNTLAYQTNSASLHYSLDFGPTLNRRWDSQVNYSTSTGEGGGSFLWLNEVLRIDHFRNLSTTYQYLLSRTQTDSTGATTGQSAVFTLQYLMYENLSSTVLLEGDYETLPGGRTYDYTAGLDEGYTRSIPLGGTFYLGGAGSYEVTDSSVSGGKVSVIDEQHIAGFNGAGFFLKNAFVIASTIVIFDTRNGGRIPTVLGVDYNVVAVGDLTEIVVIPTSVIIQPGDPLVVSYVYQTAPSARYSTTSMTVNTGVDFSWIDAAYQHQSVRQSLLSGQQSSQAFLNDVTLDTARVAVHKDWEIAGARADAFYEDYNSSVLSYTMQNYGGHLFYRPGWRMMLSADANEVITDFTSPSHHTSSQQFQALLNRCTEAGNCWTAYGRMFQTQNSQLPTETQLAAGLYGSWSYGKFQVVPVFSWINTKWGAVKTDDLHLQLWIIRYL